MYYFLSFVSFLHLLTVCAMPWKMSEDDFQESGLLVCHVGHDEFRPLGSGSTPLPTEPSCEPCTSLFYRVLYVPPKRLHSFRISISYMCTQIGLSSEQAILGISLTKLALQMPFEIHRLYELRKLSKS